MARRQSVLAQRTLWIGGVALVAAAFWIVALGVGLRAWLTLGATQGIVGHAGAFGDAAAPYMITASVLTLTMAVLGVGLALVRHLVDGPVTVSEPLEPLETLPELEPVPEREPMKELPSADEAADDDAEPLADEGQSDDGADDGADDGDDGDGSARV